MRAKISDKIVELGYTRWKDVFYKKDERGYKVIIHLFWNIYCRIVRPLSNISIMDIDITPFGSWDEYFKTKTKSPKNLI